MSFFVVFFSLDEIDVELKMARLEDLMERRMLLLNSVLLRQNPHNVQEWHKRVQLFEGNPQEVKYFYNLLIFFENCLTYDMNFLFFPDHQYIL